MPKNPQKTGIITVPGSPPKLTQKDLFPITEVEVDGIAMGVLSDGTPYLTHKGLAKVCGADTAELRRLASNWLDEQTRPRGKKIREYLDAQKFTWDTLSVKTMTNGVETHAYPDAVCMALLEYYAFDSKQGENSIALFNYRLLARATLRLYIYNRCGYDPRNLIPDSWKNYRDRVLANDQIPRGYFSVFREMSDIVVHLIQCDCPIDSHTVPDISVGTAWSKFWESQSLETAHSPRSRYGHNYPDTFPQSASNPQEVYIYPLSALPDFRTWLYANYIPTLFPKYVAGKVQKGHFLPARGELLIETLVAKALPAPKG